MANPLKELELVGYGFQFIQEVPIGVPPAEGDRSWIDETLQRLGCEMPVAPARRLSAGA